MISFVFFACTGAAAELRDGRPLSWTTALPERQPVVHVTTGMARLLPDGELEARGRELERLERRLQSSGGQTPAQRTRGGPELQLRWVGRLVSHRRGELCAVTSGFRR